MKHKFNTYPNFKALKYGISLNLKRRDPENAGHDFAGSITFFDGIPYEEGSLGERALSNVTAMSKCINGNRECEAYIYNSPGAMYNSQISSIFLLAFYTRQSSTRDSYALYCTGFMLEERLENFENDMDTIRNLMALIALETGKLSRRKKFLPYRYTHFVASF